MATIKCLFCTATGRKDNIVRHMRLVHQKDDVINVLETHNGCAALIDIGDARCAGYCFGCRTILKSKQSAIANVRAVCRMHKCKGDTQPAPAQPKKAAAPKRATAPAVKESKPVPSESFEQSLRTAFPTLFNDEDLTFEEMLMMNLRSALKLDTIVQKQAAKEQQLKDKYEAEVNALECEVGALKTRTFHLEQQIADLEKHNRSMSDQWRRENAVVAQLTKRLNKYESIDVVPSAPN